MLVVVKCHECRNKDLVNRETDDDSLKCPICGSTDTEEIAGVLEELPSEEEFKRAMRLKL